MGMRHKTLKTDFEKKATPPKRRLSHVLAASLGAVFMTAAAPQEAQAAGPPFSAIVMDANTGKTLHDRDKDKRIYPASTTKMMTALLTFEALRAGRLTPDQELNVSRNAAGQPSTNLSMMTSAPSRNANGKPRRNKKGKIIYVSAQKTKKITVEDALDGLMVRSANDAAVVLGEHLGGDRAGFAALMTKKAREIGMQNTTFFNANGLHSPTQVSTAQDMAVLLQTIIRDYPEEYKRYFSTETFSYNGKTYKNSNRLLNSPSVPGVDGGKTGYVRASGSNIVVSAERDGQRVIAGVFGASSSAGRNVIAANLVNFGFYKLLENPDAVYDLNYSYPAYGTVTTTVSINVDSRLTEAEEDGIEDLHLQQLDRLRENSGEDAQAPHSRTTPNSLPSIPPPTPPPR